MSIDRDDLAFEIVDDYLRDGPEYLTISEAASDNGFDEENDVEYISNAVREMLRELNGSL